MNVYVGNLSAGISEEKLREAFEGYGKVDQIAVKAADPVL